MRTLRESFIQAERFDGLYYLTMSEEVFNQFCDIVDRQRTVIHTITAARLLTILRA